MFQVEEKTELMDHVAHQTIVMQFILELAKSLKIDPKNCISPFFARIKLAEKQYMDAFNDELDSFKERVRQRAKARLDEAIRQVCPSGVLAGITIYYTYACILNTKHRVTLLRYIDSTVTPEKSTLKSNKYCLCGAVIGV